MRGKEKEILLALGDINEKYLEQARPRGRKRNAAKILTAAASFVIVVGVLLSAVLLGGNNPPIGNDPSADNDAPSVDNGSFPELPKPGKSLAAVIEDYLLSDIDPDAQPEDGFDYGVVLPEEDTGVPDADGDSDSNGSYVEVTDNQVAGIIEGDLYKTTDRYIFRYRNKALYIYSIAGESSSEISMISIDAGGSANKADMFLSEDGNTVTIICSEYAYDTSEALFHYYSRYDVTKVYSVDVSDVERPSVSRVLEISGEKETVRKIGNEIYLVTSVTFRKGNIDVDDASTYIPGISSDGGTHLCDIGNVYYPDEITSASYNYVTVLDEANLSLVSEYAILSDHSAYVSGVYFTDNHIVLEYQRGRKISEEEFTYEAYTVLDLIDFSGECLRYRGSLEMLGWAETGQYSYDEHDGYLRAVVSTRTWKRYWVEISNASLYVFDLSAMTLAASVENFAPEGERATAVRFEGDKLYVCTAETSTFTDPVFFFDLSDYGNITQVNTGYIEGFSSSLIDLGEGYLLGIGRESVTESKIEVYKREGDSVVSVAKYLFGGNFDSDYHAYLIDRENNLFGLALTYIAEGYGVSYGHGYFLWQFDAETESLSLILEISSDTERTYYGYARAFVRDGYLYLTSANNYDPFIVKKADVK